MSLRASSISLLALAFVATGCSSGSDKLQHENEELRRMLVETRTDLEEVKRDQEQLRAKLDYLQYSRGTGAGTAAAPAPTQPERWPADPWGATDSYTSGRTLNQLEPGTPVPSAVVSSTLGFATVPYRLTWAAAMARSTASSAVAAMGWPTVL